MNSDSSHLFTYKSKLGQGAFGCAFLVERKSNKSSYVIKEQYGIPNTQVMWNEAEILKKMRHPNIVSFYGVWQHNEKICILMKYCSAGTLYDFLKRHNHPMNEDDALYFFCQILLGLHHIHKKSVIHRDIKPANIMLHGARGDIVKIGDFGIAKNISQSAARTIIGTKSYMAPEVWRGSFYSFECDIWSAGIVLYEMITNRFPFDYHDQIRMIQQINRGIDERALHDISPTTAGLIKLMLSKNLHQRPTASALILEPNIVRAIAQVLPNMSVNERVIILNSRGIGMNENFSKQKNTS